MSIDLANKTTKDNRLALILALLAVLCWSTVATAFKIALSLQTIAQLVFIASTTSLCLLSAVLAWQKQLPEAARSLTIHWKKALLFGALNPLLYYHILLKAYQILPAQIAQPINYTWAIVLALLAVPFLHHRLSKIDLLSLLICYSGVLLISIGAASNEPSTTVKGVLFALLSTVVWAAYWILNSRDQRQPLIALWQNFIMIVPLTAALALPLKINLSAMAAAVYIGLFEMGLAFIFWLYAMRLTSNASRIGNLIFFAPFLSLYLIHTILGEDIHPNTIYGLSLIVFGLVLQSHYTNHQSEIS